MRGISKDAKDLKKSLYLCIWLSYKSIGGKGQVILERWTLQGQGLSNLAAHVRGLKEEQKLSLPIFEEF